MGGTWGLNVGLSRVTSLALVLGFSVRCASVLFNVFLTICLIVMGQPFGAMILDTSLCHQGKLAHLLHPACGLDAWIEVKKNACWKVQQRHSMLDACMLDKTNSCPAVQGVLVVR